MPGDQVAQMLSKETVKKTSQLARLKLTESEIALLATQLSAVLQNFEQIAQVKTDGVAPLVTPSEISFALRPDVAHESESEKMLEPSPEKQGRLFKVPPVVS